MTVRPPKGRTVTAAGLSGRKVTVVGLGRFGGGLGVTRWLCGQGARVTVSDKAPAAALSESVKALARLEVALHLGGHDEADFLRADLVVVNPAVPKDMPLLAAADAAGIPRTTEINLFLERCEAPVVGITGTAGKSTTAAMTAEILSRRFVTHLGGNIGGSLLESLSSIAGEHVVVLELSSFQLEDLPLVGISPQVALLTNLAPNHLDRHGTMEAYVQAKKNILKFQSAQDVMILNRACDASSQWAAEAPGRIDWFEPSGEPFGLSLMGDHNQANAQAAWAAARQFGLDRRTAAEALAKFQALPHRLSFVVERDGVRYFNDSKCTTPQGAVHAVSAFEPRRVVILVGGYDKAVTFNSLGAALAKRAKAVIAMGQTKDKIVAAVEANRSGELPVVALAEDLPAAVEVAQGHAAPGDAILLSPACASFGMFANYEERGDAFVRLVTGRIPDA